jgi:hypothetical protein
MLASIEGYQMHACTSRVAGQGSGNFYASAVLHQSPAAELAVVRLLIVR